MTGITMTLTPFQMSAIIAGFLLLAAVLVAWIDGE